MRNVLAVVTPHPRQEGVIEEAAGLLEISLTLCCRQRPAWWCRKPIEPPSSCGYDCVVMDDSLRLRIALEGVGHGPAPELTPAPA